VSWINAHRYLIARRLVALGILGLFWFGAMAQKEFIDSGDCLNCARRLEVCPRDAYHFSLRPMSNAITATIELKEGNSHATTSAD